MENHLTFEEQLKQHQAAAKTAILAQCDRLATAGITFVAAHFDGSGDDGVTEEVKCHSRHSARNRLNLPSHAISTRCDKFGPPPDAGIRLKLTIQVPPEVTPEN